MDLKLNKMLKMTDEELKNSLEGINDTYIATPASILTEIDRRETKKSTDNLLRVTWLLFWITVLLFLISIATLVVTIII